MNLGGALALKLVLTPLLVGAASLAGRRWGSAVGGWLIGIPFTSGPIAFFLALNPGPRFAAVAAVGTMAGAASQAAFCLGYAWAAQRLGWVASVLAATLGFAGATVILNATDLPPTGYFVVVILVLVVSLFLMPTASISPARRLEFTRRGGRPPLRDPSFHSPLLAACGNRRPGDGPNESGLQLHLEFPAWDLPARMIVATAFVVALTAAAPLLGAHLAGLIAPFPLYATVLAAFAHRLQGAGQAVGVVRGLLLGLFAFASFFLALSFLLPAGIAIAFAAAIALALVVQGASLFAGRRLGLA